MSASASRFQFSRIEYLTLLLLAAIAIAVFLPHCRPVPGDSAKPVKQAGNNPRPITN